MKSRTTMFSIFRPNTNFPFFAVWHFNIIPTCLNISHLALLYWHLIANWHANILANWLWHLFAHRFIDYFAAGFWLFFGTDFHTWFTFFFILSFTNHLLLIMALVVIKHFTMLFLNMVAFFFEFCETF